MRKSKLATFCAAVLAGAVAWCLWLQHKQIARLEAENQALREPSSQTEVLGQVSQGLIEEAKTEAERPGSDRQELLRLRGQVNLLRRVTQENERLQAEVDKLGRTLEQTAAQRIDEMFSTNPEQSSLNCRTLFSRVWGFAVLKFSSENDGQLPDTIAAAAPYLADQPKERDLLQMVAQATTNQVSTEDLELVYHGSLKGIEDRSMIILMRERQPVRMANGGWSRLYVFGNGFAQIEWSDDGDFTAVERGTVRR